ncbi:MAG: leucine-rich repeat domain-containing protein [Anaerostipes sp.]|nr:leucine-rich repeat domain-containing protein [Anaerostipes sp.]
MKRFLSVILCFIMAATCSITVVNVKAREDKVYTSGDYQYVAQTYNGKKTACITKYIGNATDIVLPETLDGYTVYGSSGEVFKDNKTVKSITIPKAMTNAGDCFDTASTVEQIKVKDGNSSYMSKDGILYNKSGKQLIYYPRAKKATSFTIPSTVTSVNVVAFRYTTGITKLIYNKSIKDMGELFESDVQELVLSDGITSIDEMCISNCKKLKKVILGKNVTYIGKTAFYKCSALTTIVLSKKLQSIDFYAFYDCTSLKTLKIPDSVTYINGSAFKGTKVKLLKPAYLKLMKKTGSSTKNYYAMATVKIPRKGKDKAISYKAKGITKIAGTKKSMTLKKKRTQKIYTRVYISKKKKTGNLQYDILKFTSSNPKVAKVTSHGNIKTLKKGKTTITVKLRTSGKSYKVKVKVK